MVKQIETYPTYKKGLPPTEVREGRYLVRFAHNREELDAVLRLRFEEFNLELKEGLDASFQTGRDQDNFDETCHHLAVFDRSGGEVVGTYRVQTSAMAARRGFYSAEEFDLSRVPPDVIEDAVELGRACIARAHRSTQVLFLLWKGLAAYLLHNRKRYLFGCCSLTSQDPREGKQVMELLKQGHHLHPSIYVPPQSGFECLTDDSVADEPLQDKVPQLFRIYLRYGAKVCGPPAIDRLFKTIDFFVIFDVDEMDSQTRRLFFGV